MLIKSNKTFKNILKKLLYIINHRTKLLIHTLIVQKQEISVSLKRQKRDRHLTNTLLNPALYVNASFKNSLFSQPSTRASAFRATTGCGVAASFDLTMTFVFAISTEKPGGARFFLVEAHRRAETGFAHVLLTLGLQALTARTAASVVSETAAAVLRALEPVLPELARVIARGTSPALLANVLHSLVGAFPAHGVAQSAFEAVALVRAVLAPERAVARVLTSRRHEADLAQGGGVHLGQAPPADVVAGGVRVEAVPALRGAVVAVEAVLALELAVSALPPGRALSAVTDAVELVAVVVLAVARLLAVRTVPSFPTVCAIVSR